MGGCLLLAEYRQPSGKFNQNSDRLLHQDLVVWLIVTVHQGQDHPLNSAVLKGLLVSESHHSLTKLHLRLVQDRLLKSLMRQRPPQQMSIVLEGCRNTTGIHCNGSHHPWTSERYQLLNGLTTK